MIIRGYSAGIEENINYPAKCFDESIKVVKGIQDAYKNGIKDLCLVASSCCYPVGAPQPYQESALGTGQVEESSSPHAYATIAGIEQCKAYNRQYGCHFFTAIQSDSYGQLESTHFIMQIMKRMHTAKIREEKEVVIWGDGSAIREPLYYKDADEIIAKLLQREHRHEVINIGTGLDFSVAAVARFIKEIVGYKGPLVFDCAKPQGASAKRLDVSKLTEIGLRASTNLMDGLQETYSNLLSSLRANA